MAFLILILKNLFRHKVRTLLTVIGISIGIATIVALGLITSNTAEMMEEIMRQGDFDFTVAKADSADIVLSYIKNDQIEEVKSIEGVAVASGVLMTMVQYNNNPYFFVFGIESEYSNLAGINMQTGRMFKPGKNNEVILGKIAAKNLEKRVGDSITLNNENYKVVGIYETGATFQDGGSMVDLSVAQKMQDLDNTVNMLSIKVADDYKVEEVAQKIEDNSKGDLVSIIDINDFNAIDQGMIIMDGLTWAIGLLAIIIGGVGVMNTMIMSVSERTREIGVLRALGWQRKRVLTMILGESLFIALIAIIFGSILGVIGVKLIMLSDIMEGFIDPNYLDYYTYLKAVIVSVLVALIGGFYPAYRASKLSPLEALRYE